MSRSRANGLYLASTLVLGALTLACQESLTFTGPDGVITNTDPGEPGEWSEPFPVDPGTTVRLFGFETVPGGRYGVEIDWESASNDVSFIFYERDFNQETNSRVCFVPGVDEGFFETEGLRPCSVLLQDTSSAKPKRLDVELEPGGGFLVTARNNGPGPENVRFRDIYFSRGE